MRIGILQTGDVPEELQDQHGNYNDMFVQLLAPFCPDCEFQTWRILDGVFPDEVSDCDGWLITGSKFSAYGTHPWIPPLKEFIRRIVAAGTPLVGICFGHQIITEALGGRVEKSHKGWGLGLDTYQLDTTRLATERNRITLNIFHQDQVVELPPDSVVFASSEFCPYAGLHIGEQVLTVQAHPEIRNDYNRALLTARKATAIPEQLAERAIEQLNGEEARENSDHFAALICEFFRSRRTL